MRTVKQLMNELEELVKDHPECLDYQIIYSHDDEGNEYQRVINSVNLCQLEDPNQKSYRFLEMVGYYGDGDIALEDCNSVIIN